MSDVAAHHVILSELIHTFTLAIRYSVGRGKVTAVLAMKAIPRAEL